MISSYLTQTTQRFYLDITERLLDMSNPFSCNNSWHIPHLTYLTARWKRFQKETQYPTLAAHLLSSSVQQRQYHILWQACRIMWQATSIKTPMINVYATIQSYLFTKKKELYNCTCFHFLSTCTVRVCMIPTFT